MGVELRELEIFLVLAEELHFGRTAERLYLTQPRISQTIRALEERIGGKLFERTSWRVGLTPLVSTCATSCGPATSRSSVPCPVPPIGPEG